MRPRLTAAVDRRLDGLVRARARRRSIFPKLLPEAWLRPLLRGPVQRLRMRLLRGIIAVSVLLACVVLWFALQA